MVSGKSGLQVVTGDRIFLDVARCRSMDIEAKYPMNSWFYSHEMFHQSST